MPDRAVVSQGWSRRRHLSGDLQEERGAMLIFEGRVSQAEETAMGKDWTQALLDVCEEQKRGHQSVQRRATGT